MIRTSEAFKTAVREVLAEKEQTPYGNLPCKLCGKVINPVGAHNCLAEKTAAEMFEEKHKKIRTFDSGATRDKDEHKNDYEGFFSPLVFRRYGNYMQEHRKQKDGSVRDSDNWQKGMGLAAFMKSKWRHFVDIWTIFDGYKAIDFDGAEVDLEDALCADLFNTMGYLHEVLKAKLEKPATVKGPFFKPDIGITYPQTPMSYKTHCPNCSIPPGHCKCTFTSTGPCNYEPTKE